MALILTILLLLQGLPGQAAKTGSITGTLKDSSGKPIAGVRVVAVARPESLEAFNSFSEASSLIETDEAGRFTLELVPPGKYYVAAGRIDFQTYYPGTQAMAEATAISVEAGGKVSRIDFTLRDSSAGRAQLLDGPATRFIIPVTINVERNGKVPVFGNGKFTSLKLTPVAPGTSAAVTMPIYQSSLAIPNPTGDFKVEMEGLPDGYSVKSMMYGSSVINGGILSLANAPLTLTIELSVAPHPVSGARVSGKLPGGEPRAIFLSGKSGTVYMDGSYEFADIPPGHYVVVALPRRSGERTLGTVISVRDRDVVSELIETEVPPINVRTEALTGLSAERLANLKGRIVDSESGDAVSLGKVFLVGDAWSEFNLGSQGTFEFSKLLPGHYDLEVQAVGYTTFRRSFVVDDQDITLELKTN